MDSYQLMKFVEESNRIEGIEKIRPGELEIFERFLDLDHITILEIGIFVGVCQPGASLRSKVGLNVVVGKHVPPPGGPNIPTELQKIIDRANADEDPYSVHVSYETLHPFTDGNGRSGRALWAWQMLRQGLSPKLQLGFLHAFYYQTLSAAQR